MQREVYEFISKQTWDPIIERRTCHWCWEEFPLYQWDLDLLEKLTPKVGDTSFPISKPRLCSHCKERKKLIFRNEWSYYKRKCDKCWKGIVSVSAPEYVWSPMYCFECWWSDEFDATQYGQEIDWEKSLLEQLSTLKQKVPHLALAQWTTNENSRYTQHTEFVKDCYLCGAIIRAEKSLYSRWVSSVDNIVDTYYVTKSSLCYESSNIVGGTKIFFSHSVENSSFVYFSDHIEWSSNVILSSNIHNGQYFYKNKKLSPDAWREKLYEIQAKMKTYSWLQQLLKEHASIQSNTIHKSLSLINTENSIGNEVTDSKECFCGFDAVNIENGRYLSYSRWSEDVMHVYGAYPTTKRSYDSLSLWEWSSNCYFSIVPWDHASHIYFSYWIIYNCNHIFASVCMKNGAQYCIFNKKYSEDEWIDNTKKLIQKAIDEWLRGEGLDQTLSPYPYNDSVANDYYPIYKVIYTDSTEKIINRDGSWVVYVQDEKKFLSPAILDLWGKKNIKITWRNWNHEVNIPKQMETINAENLPDSIDDIDDSILQKAIICEISKRPFRIVPMELKFYRNHGISLPRKHPDVRHLERLKKRPWRTLYLRTCDKCGVEMLSVYPQNSVFKVYCESCYQQEVYG